MNRDYDSTSALPEEWRVELPTFEGPLDLLLHLVKVNEVELTDIPVALICDQFHGYLQLMEEMNLDALRRYAQLCGWTLARAHARSGDPAAIAGYVGSGDNLDRAIADLRKEQQASDVAIKRAERQLATLEKTTPMDLEAARRSQRHVKEDTEHYFKVSRPMSIRSANRSLS